LARSSDIVRFLRGRAHETVEREFESVIGLDEREAHVVKLFGPTGLAASPPPATTTTTAPAMGPEEKRR